MPPVCAWLESIPIPSRASSLDLSESNCEAHAIFNPWWDNLSNTCHVLPKKKVLAPRCFVAICETASGSVASQRADPGQWVFGWGACLASVLWFSALGFGARLLQPVFATATAWRVLDGAIAVIMFALTASLLMRG